MYTFSQSDHMFIYFFGATDRAVIISFCICKCTSVVHVHLHVCVLCIVYAVVLCEPTKLLVVQVAL